MRKNIALIALLLPFSGYAQTKQELKQALENKYHDICFEHIVSWIGIIMNLHYIQLSLASSPEAVEELKKTHEEFIKQIKQLDKEYEQLEQA